MTLRQYQLQLPNFPRGFHLITDLVIDAIEDFPEVGLVNVFIQHSSAGITLNENADPTVRMDFETVFNKLVPENDPDYLHTYEGPDDLPAHIKATLCGSSIDVPILNRKLGLGTWQGIYLCEFRNRAGGRKLTITVTGK